MIEILKKEYPDIAVEMTGHTPRVVPTTSEQIAQVLRLASENNQPVSLSKKENFLWLDVSQLNQVIRHREQDFIVTVQSGITMGALRELLSPVHQQFPLTYPDHTLLLDVLAEDRPSLETGFLGYPRDFVLGLEIATPDGEVTKYGAEVVKNVTGYDLNKLYVGSRHRLGVITSAILKLSRQPADKKTWLLGFKTWPQALDVLQYLMKHPLPLTRCEFFENDGKYDKAIPSDRPFAVLIQISGYPKVLEKAMPFLEETVLSQRDVHVLAEKESARLDKLLLTPKADGLVLEGVYPRDRLPEIYDMITGDDALVRPWVTFRPAAGLMSLSWHEEQVPSQEALKTCLQEWKEQVNFYALTYPDTYQALAEDLNAPEKPLHQKLVKRMQQAYDPVGILSGAGA